MGPIRRFLRAIMRGLHRLVGAVLDLLDEPQPAIVDVADGPPAHWRKMVEKRAPQLLREGQRQEARGEKREARSHKPEAESRKQKAESVERKESRVESRVSSVERRGAGSQKPEAENQQQKGKRHAELALGGPGLKAECEKLRTGCLHPGPPSASSASSSSGTEKPEVVSDIQIHPQNAHSDSRTPPALVRLPPKPRPTAKPIFITTDLPPQRRTRRMTLTDTEFLTRQTAAIEEPHPIDVVPQQPDLPIARPIRRVGVKNDDFLMPIAVRPAEQIAALASPCDFDQAQWPELPEANDVDDDENVALCERQRIDRGQSWNA